MKFSLLIFLCIFNNSDIYNLLFIDKFFNIFNNLFKFVYFLLLYLHIIILLLLLFKNLKFQSIINVFFISNYNYYKSILSFINITLFYLIYYEKYLL